MAVQVFAVAVTLPPVMLETVMWRCPHSSRFAQSLSQTSLIGVPVLLPKEIDSVPVSCPFAVAVAVTL